MVTLGELQRICPTTRTQVLAKYVEPLNAAMVEFEINTPEREAMFLAQVAHESGGFNYVKELASGEAYEGRKDLGNTQAGDGVKYKGRGLIQITGRKNYSDCSAAIGRDVVASPELLETPELAARSAGWFWSSRKLNDIADRGDFLLVTKRINGGTNGFADRQAYYKRASEVLA
ncbi:chitinase A [Caudoviricetes sp.]|nr:chitinase A [Caudoviricetes sp.]